MAPRLLSAIIAICAAAAMPSKAQDAETIYADVANIRIAYSPYELRTQTGAQHLYQRIEQRAKRACSDYGRRPLYVLLSEKACAEALTGGIVAYINDPQLQRIHYNAVS